MRSEEEVRDEIQRFKKKLSLLFLSAPMGIIFSYLTFPYLGLCLQIGVCFAIVQFNKEVTK